MCNHQNLKHFNRKDRVTCLDCGKYWTGEADGPSEPPPPNPVKPPEGPVTILAGKRKPKHAAVRVAIALFALLAAAPAFAQTLVVHLPFSETSGTTALDASGNGNNGTLVNGPSRVVGVDGNALAFGGGSHVAIQTIAGIDTSMRQCAVVRQRNTASPTDRVIGTGNGSTIHTEFGIVGGNRLFYIQRTDAGTILWETAAGTFQQNAWTEICADYTRGGVPVFTIGGKSVPVSEGPGTTPGTPLTGTNRIRIAANVNASGDFIGDIDDVKIWAGPASPPPNNDPPPVVNQPPTVTLTAPQSFDLPGALTLTAHVQDDGVTGPLTYQWLAPTAIPANTTVDLTKQVLTIDSPLQGAHNFTFRVSDGQFTAEKSVSVVVVGAASVQIQGMSIDALTNGAFRVELWIDGQADWVDAQKAPEGKTMANRVTLQWRQAETVPLGVHRFRIVRCSVREPNDRATQCTEELRRVEKR